MKRFMILTLIAMGGCMGAPLPIDVAPDGGSPALIQCRLILQEPFAADVTSPNARCMNTDLGMTVEWGRTDAPFSISVSLIADPGLTWQGNPCNMSAVNFDGDEIDFHGVIHDSTVSGTITIGD